MTYIYNVNRPIQQAIPQQQQPAAAAPRTYQRQAYAPAGYFYQTTAAPQQAPPATYAQQTYVMQPGPQQFQMVQFPAAASGQPMFYPAEDPAIYAGQQIQIGIPAQPQPAQPAPPPPPPQQPIRYTQAPPPPPPAPQPIQQPSIDVRKRKKEVVSPVSHPPSIPQSAQIYTAQPVQKRQAVPVAAVPAQTPIYAQPPQHTQTIQQPQSIQISHQQAQAAAAVASQQQQQALQMQEIESLQQRSLENCLPKVPTGFPVSEFATPPGCFNIIKRGNLPGLSFSQITI